MKRKLVYDETEEENKRCKIDLCTRGEAAFDFDPIHFLRCHSSNNDDADVKTQVWHCVFEPNNSDTVATCGGNSVCFINVESGEVEGKYYSDKKDNFFTLSWTTISNLKCEENILAVAGASRYIHLLHPGKNVMFYKHTLSRDWKNVSSLLFHPLETNILFCSLSKGDVIVFDIGCPLPPQYKTSFVKLYVLSAESEIFSLSFSLESNVLLAACNEGLRGWRIKSDDEMDTAQMLVFEHPSLQGQNSSQKGNQLVDSVEVLSNGFVATKCALHGNIYVWNIRDTLKDIKNQHTLKIAPSYVLKWKDTDNYFMYMGFNKDLLVCGDDKGALWIYNTRSFISEGDTPSKKKDVKPTLVLPWPDLLDTYCERRGKVRLDLFDIVVDKATVSGTGQYIVAVTSNNMVCVWKKVKV
ncbi:hypothetical protein R5R35_011776 [Gryllus longicercus]|uniref:Leucine-rich repeat and WD repeat-containing protein 1 WD domain-containing protein n=1 Tax=Gryllus longicercus TaxID=2509291 RepID=A0AAN9VTW5_9ORTH